jgi:S-formylglutathione hydrolase FrmB
MGGFGAMRSGLAYPETYGNIIAISSAFITNKISKLKKGERDKITTYENYRYIFGELDSLVGSHNDPMALAKKLVSSSGEFPQIYMSCGTEDFLIEENREFHEGLKQLNVKHKYLEKKGIHNWIFGQEQLIEGIAWLNE